MREMKNSGVGWIGQIPQEWCVHRNKTHFDCSKSIVGVNSSTMQLLSLTTKGIVKKRQDALSGKVPESFDTYQSVSPNDIVMCLFDLDCSAVFSGISPFFGMISPAYKVLQCANGMVPQYADYWFSFVFNGRKFAHYSKNLRFTLTYEEFSALPVVVPPANEQQRIADFLDRKCEDIKNVLDKTKASIEEYKKLKQSIITEAVTKGIRGERKMKESGIEWIGEIPEEWGVMKLRHLGACQNGISKGSEFFGEGFPFISYSDVYKNISLPLEVSGRIQSTESEQELFSVRRGDIFFTRTSETIEEIGFSSVCLANIPQATFAGFVIRVRPFTDTLLPEFSKYYFRSNIHGKYFIKEMNLVTRASLGQGLLKGLPVLVPCIKEQEEIASYLDQKCCEIDSLIESKEIFVKELDSYRKTLVFEYVTGKKEVIA